MKLVYIIGAIVALIATYFMITSYWSALIVPAVTVAANATDNTTYPFASATIRSAPIWLYLIPAACIVFAVVVKLRERGAGR